MYACVKEERQLGSWEYCFDFESGGVCIGSCSLCWKL